MHLERRHASHSLAAILVLALLFPTRPARAEEMPPSLVRDVGAYALFGRSYLKWLGAASMPNRASTGSNTIVEITDDTDASGDESFVAAESVWAREVTKLHAVFAYTFSGSAYVTLAHPVMPLEGKVVRDADWPRLPDIDCGGADITVDGNSPFHLKPGRYNVVTVMQDQTMRLDPAARYEICSLRLRPGATVEAHTGTFVLIRDYLSTGARARITGTGACGARWIAGAATTSPAPASAGFEFAQGTGSQNRALIEGQFFTPGRITMAQHNDYVGRFWAERIDGSGAENVTRTLGDCEAPQCGDGVLDAGEACDDGNNLEGDCCSAFCELLPSGSACDDGLFCTTGDVCGAGGVCAGAGNPCDAPDGDFNCSESCNEETDACNAPDPDGSACDDGVFCNGADVCASGGCVAHAGSPCAGFDDDANCFESCDETTRSCTAQDTVGAPCNDGRFCTIGESCDAAGSCSGGTTPCPGSDYDANCSESCDELTDSCTAIDAVGTACDDGLFCTATDQCDGRGSCRGWGDPCASQLADGDGNCSETCSEDDDACSAPDIDGSPCTDGFACTLGERCIGGSCAASGETSCDDGNPCTDEFCAPDGECLRSYNEAPCNDGNACTLTDRCDAGSCIGRDEVDCRDDDLCSSDVCDPADGSCHHSYAPATSCHEMGGSVTKIELGYSPKDGQLAESLTTSWRGAHKLDPTAREELGDPSAGDPFAVCFYDEHEGLPELAYRLDFDDATTRDAIWKRTWRASDLTYKLKAPLGTTQGVSQIRLGVDKHGSPAFKLKAGANSGCGDDCRAKFEPPSGSDGARMFRMQPGMTVQWVASTGACWSTRYEEAAVNTDQSFHARKRAPR